MVDHLKKSTTINLIDYKLLMTFYTQYDVIVIENTTSIFIIYIFKLRMK